MITLFDAWKGDKPKWKWQINIKRLNLGGRWLRHSWLLESLAFRCESVWLMYCWWIWNLVFVCSRKPSTKLTNTHTQNMSSVKWKRDEAKPWTHIKDFYCVTFVNRSAFVHSIHFTLFFICQNFVCLLVCFLPWSMRCAKHFVSDLLLSTFWFVFIFGI